MDPRRRLESDLEYVRFLFGGGISTPMPREAGQPAPWLSLGSLVVLHGDREATRDFALDVVRRGMGVGRRTVVVGALERAYHLRLLCLFSPYGLRSHDFRVDRPEPRNASWFVPDLGEVLDSLQLTVAGLGDDIESFLDGLRDHLLPPVDVLALLDADSAPQLLDCMTQAVVDSGWRASSAPEQTLQLARTLNAVTLVTLTTDDDAQVTGWGRVADLWMHVRADRADPVHGRPRLILKGEGGSRSEGYVLQGEIEEPWARPDAEVEDLWSPRLVKERRLARLESNWTRVELPLDNTELEEGVAYRFEMCVDAVQRRMTRSGKSWATLSSLAAGVEHTVVVFPEVYDTIDAAGLVVGIRVRVLATRRVDEPATFVAETLRIVKPESQTAPRPVNNDSSMANLEKFAAAMDGIHVVPMAEYGWPGSSELALIDAVLSIRANYGNSSETGVRRRVLAYRGLVGVDCDDLARLARHPREELAEVLKTRQKSSGVLKIDLIQAAAAALADIGVNQTAEVDPANARQKAAWTGIHGLGWVTWEYFGMLLGRPGVKADTMIQRFVSRALGEHVSAHRSGEVVKEWAVQNGWSATDVDHAIWNAERRRR